MRQYNCSLCDVSSSVSVDNIVHRQYEQSLTAVQKSLAECLRGVVHSARWSQQRCRWHFASMYADLYDVVEKITTRRREGVVVEKNEKSRRTFNKNSCDLLTAITHTEILCALYKTN